MIKIRALSATQNLLVIAGSDVIEELGFLFAYMSLLEIVLSRVPKAERPTMKLDILCM